MKLAYGLTYAMIFFQCFGYDTYVSQIVEVVQESLNEINVN